MDHTLLSKGAYWMSISVGVGYIHVLLAIMKCYNIQQIGLKESVMNVSIGLLKMIHIKSYIFIHPNVIQVPLQISMQMANLKQEMSNEHLFHVLDAAHNNAVSAKWKVKEARTFMW
eukprot:9875514-Ditylum_brightwellii.AAC.1